MLEVSAVAHRLMFALGARLARQGGAALFIDYGHGAPASATRCRRCARSAWSIR